MALHIQWAPNDGDTFLKLTSVPPDVKMISGNSKILTKLIIIYIGSSLRPLVRSIEYIYQLPQGLREHILNKLYYVTRSVQGYVEKATGVLIVALNCRCPTH